MVAENLAQVQKNINESCNKINRDPNEVTLIAVSKTKPVEMLKEAYDAGARVFGENKVQEIVDKYDQMPSDVKWHMSLRTAHQRVPGPNRAAVRERRQKNRGDPFSRDCLGSLYKHISA